MQWLTWTFTSFSKARERGFITMPLGLDQSGMGCLANRNKEGD
nr:hypothetical protein [uncultured Schaedlerella sp.]